MEPFKALIVPLVPPTEPPTGGQPPEINNDLPLFPFHPIVVPPGGNWPGEPPTSGGGERPNHDLPLFPFHPIVVPPGGAYPPPDGGTQPPDPNAPKPTHPINLPPEGNEGGWWVMVYVPGVGWAWVAMSPGGKPPENTMPQPK